MNIDKLPIKILAKSGLHMRAELHFVAETVFFAGHFPELPLLPGVVQAHLAIRVFEENMSLKLNFRGFKNLKFYNPILPGTVAILECDLNTEKKQLTFHYFQGDSTFSNGVMVLADA